MDATVLSAYLPRMSKKLDTFKARLLEAAKRKHLPPSQTQIGEFLGISKSQVDVWMTQGSMPRAEPLFKIADKLGVEARWLATGEGSMVFHPSPENLDAHERELLERYRAADKRWQLSIRLLTFVATEDQAEIAGDVNMVIARVFGKRPQDINYISDERARQAIGDAPHVSGRVVKESVPHQKGALQHKKSKY